MTRALLLPTLFAILLCGSAFGFGPIINEFMASNGSTLADADGDFPDWIEIYNPAGSPVNLGGWHLTDRANNLTMWQFPSVTIPAGGYLVVFASSKDRTDSAELHTNFSLSIDGEYLALVAPDGSTIMQEFAPEFPQQFRDVSYGFYNGELRYFTSPTPGGPNIIDELASGPIISEFMASNGTTLADEDGHYPDWIEIHNPTAVPINLNGWHLTDRANNRDMWRFPSVTIPAGGYLVVFASSKDRAVAGGQLHTNFSLSSDGEFLALVEPDGWTIAHAYAPEYPQQFRDVSYGLVGTEFRYFTSPTPGSPNSGGLVGYIDGVNFSVQRGFYEDSFVLHLSTDVPGTQIRYTLNGRQPTASYGTIYAGPIAITTTTVVRAAAFRSGYLSAESVSHTYIFLNDVLVQSHDQTSRGFPDTWYAGASSTGSYDRRLRPADYEMDPKIVNDPHYGPQMIEALTSIPTVALTFRPSDLWDSNTGIYPNSIMRARTNPTFEKPMSMEFIDPLGLEESYSINAGARMMGELARWPAVNDKQSFRVLFKSQYGANRLRADFFGDPDVDRYNTIVFRANWGDGWVRNASRGPDLGITWLREGPETSQYLRDIFVHDAFRDTGNLGVRGRFVHLYLNGVYWGLFQAIERPDDAFAAEHLGGPREHYDVIKGAVGGSNVQYNGVLKEGNRVAYNTMLHNWFDTNASGYSIAGQVTPISDADLAAIEQWLDVDQFIDYMITLWTYNRQDFPRKNWYALCKRNPDGGPPLIPFQFHTWDSEAAIGQGVDEGSRWPDSRETGDRWNRDDAGNDTGPVRIYRRLITNATFRRRWADRAHELMTGDGPLTGANSIVRYMARANEIDTAIIGESARWGDSPYQWNGDPVGVSTRDDEWITELNHVIAYLEVRTGYALQQMAEYDLYPSIDQPVFSQDGGEYEPGTLLTITNPNSGGMVWVTLDGSDPRASTTAFSLTMLPLQGVMHVRASVRHDGQWSLVTDAVFMPAGGPTLAVTEIMYNPPEEKDGVYSTQEYEFIEVQNIGGAAVSLAPIAFVDGIRFDFADGDFLSLAPGEYAVVVRNLDAFIERYGPGLPVAGVYSGALDNSGERIALAAAGMEFSSFTYDDGGDWPWLPDGFGASLERVDTAMDPDDPAAWRASSEYLGTPGAAGAGPIRDVVVNEVLTHTDEPEVDAIELHNTTGAAIDISGWYLSDSSATFHMFRIPDGTVMAPDTYLVFDEDDFNVGETGFALSRFGEEVWLMAADADGNLTRFVDHVEFGPLFNGWTFGRHPNGEGELAVMAENRLGSPNSGPYVSPVVISEIHYHPAEVAGMHEADLEFIKLHNHTDHDVPLDWFDASGDGVVDPDEGGWALTRGVRFDFPVGTSIPAQGYLLVVGFDPTDAATLDAFCDVYDIPALAPGVDLVGPWEGRLSNSGERVRLAAADNMDLSDGTWPMVTMDEVRYGVTAPWPEEAGGYGASLHRVAPSAFGNFVHSWVAAPPAPGDVGDIGLVPGDINGDGRVDLDDFLILKQNFGRTDATRAEGDLNGDGRVDFDDFLILKQNFGQW